MPATTPVFSRQARTMSPPLSHAPTASSQSLVHKLNVVTRLAIEGKARQSEPGAAIKMYLRISLPLDSVTPGSTIPLFAEENIKILTSQTHPIDSNSVPYNFSSAVSPLLHNAARALMLPARSSQSYLALFGFPFPSRNSPSPSSLSNSTPKLDDKYTGHILVSGYHVSFVLPKEFPPKSSLDLGSVDSIPSSSRRRRQSVSEKNTLQFMAAIELMVPFLSRPPRAPYLLSIPTPRCLSNTIRLRIFPPSTTASSFASLSSAEEEGSSWDLTSDPYVTRSSLRPSRGHSYTHFADDESSDSSNAGFSDGCGIQGTFPSTECIRVRWAAPMKSIDLPTGGDARRKVGVRDVKGEMTCAVLGKGKDASAGSSGRDGVIMRVEYKVTCKGVWFPGVATLLGMDLGLLARNSDVAWLSGTEGKWTVTGGQGFTGWDVVGSSPLACSDSAEDDAAIETPIIPAQELKPFIRPRYDSNNASTSAASLLRAPLPAQNVAEYSFEGSGTSSALPGSSPSISSLGPSPNGTRSRANSITSAPVVKGRSPDVPSRPPVLPITVHINMNDLLPPSKNILTVNISGTILVTPRNRMLNSGGFTSRSSSPLPSDDEFDLEPIVLPYFNVFAADSESTIITLRNEADGATVDVYNPSGDLREAQTRRTVLQKGGFTKCGMDGERIAVRLLRTPVFSKEPYATRGPNGILGAAPSPAILRRMGHSSTRQTSTASHADGPLMIPSVLVNVTPLLVSDGVVPEACAVRARLPVPVFRDSAWFEFGFAEPASAALGSSKPPPRVEIASVSVGGVPVRFDAGPVSNQDKNDLLAGLRLSFEDIHETQWLMWAKAHVGNTAGGEFEVNYICKEVVDNTKKGKAKAQTQLLVLLPTFTLPVGLLEVYVESPGLEVLAVETNLKHQQSTPSGPRLMHHSAAELFQPRLILSVQSTASISTYTRFLIFWSKAIAILTPIICICLVFCVLHLGTELHQVKHSIVSYPSLVGGRWNDAPQAPATVTVVSTSTVFTSEDTAWWLSASSTVSLTTLSPSPSPEKMSSQEAEPTETTSHEQASASAPADYALLPVHSSPFHWPLRFNISPPNITLEHVLKGLRKVWAFCRTAYHYPLPPPP